MFDIGFWEIALIFIVLLLVVGPERLPKVVRTLGLWIGKARRMVAEVKAEVDRELRVEELKQSFQQQVPSDEFKRLADQVRSINREVKDSIDQRQPVPQQMPGRPNFDKPAAGPSAGTGTPIGTPAPAGTTPPAAPSSDSGSDQAKGPAPTAPESKPSAE